MAPVNNQFTFYEIDFVAPAPSTNSFRTGTGLHGLSLIDQTSKELVTSIRLQKRECATIGKLLHASEVILQSTAENFNMAVLVERVGVPDDYASTVLSASLKTFLMVQKSRLSSSFWQEIQVISYLGQNIKFLFPLCIETSHGACKPCSELRLSQVP